MDVKRVDDRETLRKVTLLAASGLTVMAGATIAPALPDIAETFADVKSIDLLAKLVLTLPALFIAIGAPLAGLIIDRWGRKRLFIVSVLLYAAAGSSGFYVDSLLAILIGRAVLGLAIGGVNTCVTTLIGDYFVGPTRDRFVGHQSAFIAFGGVVFLIGGGLLADLGWRLPFLIYLSSLIILPKIVLSIYEPERSPVKSSPETENSHAVPVWPVLLVYALAFFGMIVFYLIPVQLPFHIRILTGATGSAAGLALASFNVCAAFSAWNFKRVRLVLSNPAIVALAFLIMGAGYVIISYAGNYELMYAGLMCSGFGLGLHIPTLSIWLLGLAPERVRGRLVGGFTTCIFLGQFFSPIVARPIIDRAGVGESFGIAGLALLALAVIFAGFAVFRGDVRA